MPLPPMTLNQYRALSATERVAYEAAYWSAVTSEDRTLDRDYDRIGSRQRSDWGD